MSSVPLDAARRALRATAILPSDIADWRLAHGVRPGDAIRLVREERTRRALICRKGRAA